jgi:4-hydroxy-tetrahydrodipicolinate synthase
MKSMSRIGLSCALITPFTSRGGIDLPLLSRHALRTLNAGCDSITLFGTTGEGPAVSTSERYAAYGAMVGSGLEMRRQVIGGIIATPFREAIEQARMIYDADCRAVLLAPPFYFPEPTEDGVFAWFASVIESLGAAARDIILYHIPQFTGVSLTVSLVRRLAKAFPQVIIGVKDSKGVWVETESRIRAHSELQILVGNEADLSRAVRIGAAGTICGFANFIAASLRPVANDGAESDDIARLAGVIDGFHFLSAFKTVMAHLHNEPNWLNMRAPLSPLAVSDAKKALDRWSRAFSSKAA